MDLLGSILNSMQKPPEKSEKEKKAAKEQKAKYEKQQEEIRKVNEKFHARIEKKVSEFIADPVMKRFKFEAMDKIARTVVYEVSESAGLISQAFGKDSLGERYIMLFKKDFPPSEAEMSAYRRGETWNEEKEKQERKRVDDLKREAATASPSTSAMKKNQRKQKPKAQPVVVVEPATNYKDKYNHLIGKLAAKDAARATKANECFGMVPSKNKRDLRSIEETLNAISAKKRRKKEEEERNKTQDP